MFGKSKARVVKSTQEQAVAAWIDYLNQVRVFEMLSALNRQDGNLQSALAELDKIKQFIANPEAILGSSFTKHGEIAEHMQVHISNARGLIKGLAAQYTFDGVGRTAPEDYLFNGQMVQSKFYNGTKRTLEAVRCHLEKYPYFVQKGGFYEIPKEQYAEINRVLELKETNISALSKSDFSLLQKMEEFQKVTGLNFKENVRPAVVDYPSAQLGASEATIQKEVEAIQKQDRKQRSEIFNDGKPTIKEGAKATAVGALFEGGVGFCMAVVQRRRTGKQFSDFTEEDWKEILNQTGTETLKGGVRGAAVYAMNNFTVTPANLASAYVTAAFGVAAQAESFRNGTVSKEDFVVNCEAVVLDASVSVIAATLGQAVIPIPVLGALLGNVVGELVYGLCQQYADENEQKLIRAYQKKAAEWKQQSDEQLEELKKQMHREMKHFSSLEEMAFGKSYNKAFSASGELARTLRVEEKEILKSGKEIGNYFG